MSEPHFPSSTFVFAAANADGIYFPQSQVNKKKVLGVARKVTWGDKTLNVELVFAKKVSKANAEKAIHNQAEKITALAELYFNKPDVNQMHLSKKQKLSLTFTDGRKIKSQHGITKELSLRKGSLEARLKTILTDEEKNQLNGELTQVKKALALYKKGGFFQRIANWFKDLFITDASVIANAITSPTTTQANTAANLQAHVNTNPQPNPTNSIANTNVNSPLPAPAPVLPAPDTSSLRNVLNNPNPLRPLPPIPPPTSQASSVLPPIPNPNLSNPPLSSAPPPPPSIRKNDKGQLQLNNRRNPTANTTLTSGSEPTLQQPIPLASINNNEPSKIAPKPEPKYRNNRLLQAHHQKLNAERYDPKKDVSKNTGEDSKIRDEEEEEVVEINRKAVLEEHFRQQQEKQASQISQINEQQEPSTSPNSLVTQANAQPHQEDTLVKYEQNLQTETAIPKDEKWKKLTELQQQRQPRNDLNPEITERDASEWAV